MEQDVMKVKKGQVMRIPNTASGCRVACLFGVLWLTKENDPEDYIITADSDLVVQGRGRSVIEAVTDCVVCITQGEQGGMHDLA